MRHTLPIAPQFYVTAPQSCPYLEGQVERKLFTALQGDGAEELNNTLSKQGFRRSQNVLYRPSCAECSACMSARIDVSKFKLSKSQKRVLARNRDLHRKASSPWAKEEQYALFRNYLDARHADGGMADMDVFEFAAMVEETPIPTRVIEYRSDAAPNSDLSAVCLTDVLEDGVSMVYSFFDPDRQRTSMGTYIILDHVNVARDSGLPYVYLGYWVPGSKKMAYKSNFSGLEIFRHGSWQAHDPDTDYSADSHPLDVTPITEQVAKITLPNSAPVKP